MRIFAGLAVATLVIAGSTGLSLAAGPYDGTYHGTLTGSDSNAPVCAKKAPAEMTVTDSQLVYHHMGNSTVTATVAPDGSFSGSAQNNYSGGGKSRMLVQTLTGKIAAGGITAQTDVGGSCAYLLSLKKF